jgi:hypothetical protein
MRSEIGKFKRIGPRRKDILVVILWTAAISLIMIKAYMLFYLHSPLGQEFWVVYDWPGLEWYDMVILTVLSIACTMILSDAESIVYGFAASLILSFIISVTYVHLVCSRCRTLFFSGDLRLGICVIRRFLERFFCHGSLDNRHQCNRLSNRNPHQSMDKDIVVYSSV